VPIKETVVQGITQLCAERNIKINALANLAGITPSTLYSLLDESRKDIGIVTLKKLCDGSDISITEFFDTDAFRKLEQEIE